jgi:hypothetical protein
MRIHRLLNRSSQQQREGRCLSLQVPEARRGDSARVEHKEHFSGPWSLGVAHQRRAGQAGEGESLMNRFTVTFIVLTATGGCMALDQDSIDDYPYRPSRRPPAQSQAWPSSSSAQWGGTNGQTMQPTYSADWGTGPTSSRTSTASSWSNSPQNTSSWSNNTQSTTTAAMQTSTSRSSTDVASAKPATSTRATDSKTAKTDDQVVKAAYVSKGGSDGESCSMRTSATKASHTPEPKSPPVNLGVLRLLNNKRITFHYEVKDPAAVGVASMEMWGTTDMRSWKKYDIVSRGRSSLVVEVKEEALYGFSMIARGKNELGKNQPPLTGEAPQVWVCVDLTKPDVQLLGAELNIMSKTPSLVIRWTAKDRNLGPRPITLLYAERMEGPWTPIAANLENNGRYDWNMPGCVPPSVFVRVQAVDLMGNTGMAQTTTLHIPGRSSRGTAYNEPKLADPPALSTTLPPPPPTSDSNLRPVAITVPEPAVNILSVDNE